MNKIYKVEEISEEQLNDELIDVMISFFHRKIDKLYLDILKYKQNNNSDKEFISKLLAEHIEIVNVDRKLVDKLNNRMLHKVNVIIEYINNIVSNLSKDSIKYINNRKDELKYTNSLNNKSKEELIDIIKNLKNNK